MTDKKAEERKLKKAIFEQFYVPNCLQELIDKDIDDIYFDFSYDRKNYHSEIDKIVFTIGSHKKDIAANEKRERHENWKSVLTAEQLEDFDCYSEEVQFLIEYNIFELNNDYDDLDINKDDDTVENQQVIFGFDSIEEYQMEIATECDDMQMIISLHDPNVWVPYDEGEFTNTKGKFGIIRDC